MPWAPGTWGSVVGILLGGPVRLPWPLALALSVVLVVMSAAVCGRAAAALGEPDPRAVVLDETVAMATVCWLLPWVISTPAWIIAFLLFRFFDIVKPPPLRTCERLPGGWGIVADDVGAAAYTIGVLSLLRPWIGIL